MELLSTARAGGEPLVCAYGCVPEGRGLRAGMLFVRAGLTERTTEFEEPTTREKIILLLPESALNLEQNGRAYGATLSPATPEVR